MRTKELGFFQVLGYLSLFVLLGALTWANLFLSDNYSLTVMAGAWAVVLSIAIILRLFSVRTKWGIAIETAWLALLVFCWILILLDTAVCGFSDQAFCQPDSMSILGYGQELSIATYSLIIIALVLSALCFPWGLPIVFLWLQLVPAIFASADLPTPDYFSPFGRFILFFPAILMAPLGYWLWFCLIPELGNSTLQALRVKQIKSGSLRLANKMKKLSLSLLHKAKVGLQKLKEIRLRKKEDDQEDQRKKPTPGKRPTGRK
jgi:hypothetical protein